MKFQVRNQVLARMVDDEIVILDSRTNEYLGLNATGAVIWNVLAEGRSVTEAVEALIMSFDVDRGTAETDVAALIGTLQELDVIAPVAQ